MRPRRWWSRLPLRGKILSVALLGILLPLLIGLAQALGAPARGRALLRSQLQRSLEQVASEAEWRWSYRQGDLLLLATNAPVRAGLAGDSVAATAAERYLRGEFGRMHGIRSVAFLREGEERPVWEIGEPPQDGDPDALTVRLPIPDAAGRRQGELLATLRLTALVPGTPVASAAGSTVLAVLTGEGGLVPAGFAAREFRADAFERAGEPWLTARREPAGAPVELVLAAPARPFIAPFERAGLTHALALLAAAVAALWLAGRWAGRLTAGTERLAVAAEAVADGRLDTRLPVLDEDEIGRLARAFNTMTDSLQRTLARLSQREALATLGEFAASIAHEVRNPLTAIRIDLQRLTRHGDATQEVRETVGRALDQLQRLDRVVAGSLELASSGRLDRRAVRLQDVLRRAAHAAAPHFEQRSAALTLSVAELPGIAGDAAALEQLFLNLLLNAAQASPPGGRTDVRAALSEGHVLVEVEDDGAGIPPDRLARLGEPFFTTREDGTGLGVAIAKRIAAAHAGSLDFRSAPGQGTTVRVRLPLS